MAEAPTRLEKLIAMMILMQMQSSTQQEKVVAMSRAGFSNPEIAELLDTKANIVAQHLYASKNSKPTRSKTRKTRGEPGLSDEKNGQSA